MSAFAARGVSFTGTECPSGAHSFYFTDGDYEFCRCSAPSIHQKWGNFLHSRNEVRSTAPLETSEQPRITYRYAV